MAKKRWFRTKKDGSFFTWLATLNGQEQIIFATLIAVGFAMGAMLGTILLALLRFHAVVMIWASLCLGLLLMIASAIWAFVSAQWVAGAFVLLMVFGNVLFVYFAQHRIPLTAGLLSTASQVTKMYPAQIGFAVISLVAHFVYTVMWTMTLSMSQQVAAIRGPGPFVFLLLSFFWTHQVMQNLVHTVCCGVFASWYFYDVQIMPANPTVASAKRACTSSFGSVAFGSLLVALVQMVRAGFSMLKLTDHDLIVCFVDCFLGLIDQLVEFFNTYAFSYVAIYGLSFTKAARRVWRLLMDRGWTTVINDSLTSGVLVWGSITAGAIVALTIVVISMVMNFIDPSVSNVMFPLIGLLGFAIGYSVVRVMLQPIDSGVVTLFVCCAESPAALQHRQPELFATLRERYPDLMTGIVEPIHDPEDNNE